MIGINAMADETLKKKKENGKNKKKESNVFVSYISFFRL